MHNVQTTIGHNSPGQAGNGVDNTSRDVDLTELDEQAWQRFMQELLADLAQQRSAAQRWRLRAPVVPMPDCTLA